MTYLTEKFIIQLHFLFSDVGAVSQFSLFKPPKSDDQKSLSQYQQIQLTKSELKDFDYTFAPSKEFEYIYDDDEASYDYTESAGDEKKSIAENELQSPIVSSNTFAPPSDIHDYQHQDRDTTYDNAINVNNDQATYNYDENQSYFTTHSTFTTRGLEDISNDVTYDQADDSYFNNKQYEYVDHIDDKADVDDDVYDISPKLKTDNIPNSNFKSDFFNNMNIQEMVFSIPGHFRKYLEEPPSWINKDYW